MAQKNLKIDYTNPINIDVDLVERFAEHFAPAETFAQADEYWNSAQLDEFMKKLYPGYDYVTEFFLEELMDSGYRNEAVDGEVMWLLKRQ